MVRRITTERADHLVRSAISSCASWILLRASKLSSNKKVVSFIIMLMNRTNCLHDLETESKSFYQCTINSKKVFLLWSFNYSHFKSWIVPHIFHYYSYVVPDRKLIIKLRRSTSLLDIWNEKKNPIHFLAGKLDKTSNLCRTLSMLKEDVLLPQGVLPFLHSKRRSVPIRKSTSNSQDNISELWVILPAQMVL